MPLNRSQKPFVFKSQMSLVEMTGLRAGDLAEFCLYLKEVPESSVYYHTHHFLQQHQFLVPEPPNDFAYWVAGVLQEEELGERLAAIDTVQFHTLGELRGAITAEIDRHLEKNKNLRKAPPGEEFYFMKCILFTFPTACAANDLKEFLVCLERVSVGCLYNHIFEARLRPPLGVNDFSYWLRDSLGEEGLAKRIEGLDPYTHTLDGLRKNIVRLVEKRIGEGPGG